MAQGRGGGLAHPPLPYTASDLQLEDHPATRDPAYYTNSLPPARASSAGPSGSAVSGGSREPRSPESRRARAHTLAQAARERRTARDRAAAAAGGAGVGGGVEGGVRDVAGGGGGGGGVVERDLCCALLGPCWPFWGATSLSDMATSRVMPLLAFMAWRLFLAALAIAAIVLTAVSDAYSLRGTQLIALVFAAYIALRLLFVSNRYRAAIAADPDDYSVHEPTTGLSHVALTYQGNVALQLFSPLGLLFTIAVEEKRADTSGKLYDGNILILAPIAALAAVSLLDVLLSSIPFRLTYVLPTTLYGMIFMLLSILRFGKDRRGFYIGLSAGLLVAISLVTLLYGRASNLVLRKKSQAQLRTSRIHSFGGDPPPRANEPERDLEGHASEEAF